MVSDFELRVLVDVCVETQDCLQVPWKTTGLERCYIDLKRWTTNDEGFTSMATTRYRSLVDLVLKGVEVIVSCSETVQAGGYRSTLVKMLLGIGKE